MPNTLTLGLIAAAGVAAYFFIPGQRALRVGGIAAAVYIGFQNRDLVKGLLP